MKIRKHGILRGLEEFIEFEKLNKADHALLGRGRIFDGKFGRMFPDLNPAGHADNDLMALAIMMIAEREPEVTSEMEADGEDNTGISAGYTYLGQFIDHDLTFDPVSKLQEQNDLPALIDYRTPRFDLDNIYGRGPDDQPYLYENDGLRFLLGDRISGNPVDFNTHDLPRSRPNRGPRRALIGDPRNDENIIVSQLQGIFLRFHNSVVDYLRSIGGNPDFEEVQNIVRWHYQWMLINDFLPTIVQRDVIDGILPHLAKGTTFHDDPPVLKYLKVNENSEPFMPLEFSVAAYRFGHSMIRPVYRLNPYHQRMFIFPDLIGFDAVPDGLAIDWRLFFDFGKGAPSHGSTRVQPAYKIDSKLVEPLGNLPASVASQNMPSLSARNLLRGRRMLLPSGQDVARALGLTPMEDKDLKIGKAAADAIGEHKLFPIEFKGNTPLWAYVLSESLYQFDGKDETPIRLGPVGGTIVAEVFLWLLMSDKLSVFNARKPKKIGHTDEHEPWTPFADFMRINKTGKREFGIAELILQAQKA